MMSKLESVTTLIQTVFAASVFYLTIGYFFERSYLPLLEILLGCLVFVIAFNNKLFYKSKYITPLCVMFGLFLMMEVFI